MTQYIRILFTHRGFATLILTLFVLHYIPWESRAGVSWIKTTVSIICCGYVATQIRMFTKVLPAVAFMYITMLLSAFFHLESFRSSTLLYNLLFLATFITMYDLVYAKGVLTLSYYTKIVKRLFCALFICLIIQQAFLMAGISYFPAVNLCQVLGRGIGANSLTMEPSVYGRLNSVLMYCYMQCVSLRQGYKFGYRQFLEKEHRPMAIMYVWALLTMGSGTAFAAAGILSLYFINWRNAILLVPLMIGGITLGQSMGNESFDRALNTAQATSTLDADEVRSADGSASARITPMLNTIHRFDISDPNHWLGYGTDAGHHNTTPMIFEDYGFLHYLACLTFVFNCCFHFASISTLMFFVGVGGGTGNIAYGWGILMTFMCLRYFIDANKRGELVIDEEEEEEEEEKEEEEEE